MPKQSKRSPKEELMRRLEGDYNRKKGGGTLFRSDLRGVNFWSCKEAEHLIDIIPYTAGDMDPIEPGSESYVLEFYVHNNVCQVEGMTICLAETFNKPCPICEDRRHLIKIGGDEQRIKDLTPSRYPRSIYNVVCYDSADEKNKGVQIWHTSNFLFQQYLLALAKKPMRSGQKNFEPFIAFMDVDEGKSIAFTREGKEKNTKFIGIRFEDRDYKINDEIKSSAHVLDELIAWPTYEEVYKAYWGTDCSSAGSAVTSRESRNADYEKEMPVSTYERNTKHFEKDENEKQNVQTTQRDSSINKCPAGKNFGVDIDDLKECDNCTVWKDCAKEADAIERSKK